MNEPLVLGRQYLVTFDFVTFRLYTPKHNIYTEGQLEDELKDIDDIDLSDLDLNLEAIPTVSAPTINNTTTTSAFNAPMARGRSSG